jgi:hypothetical protein
MRATPSTMSTPKSIVSCTRRATSDESRWFVRTKIGNSARFPSAIYVSCGCGSRDATADELTRHPRSLHRPWLGWAAPPGPGLQGTFRAPLGTRGSRWAARTKDSYAAARVLLVDEIGKLGLAGGAVALIPSRDLLLLAGAKDSTPSPAPAPSARRRDDPALVRAASVLRAASQ